MLRSVDIAYDNCEQLLADNGTPTSLQAVCSNPKYFKKFFYSGFDIISLANNHVLDWGSEDLLDAMERLKTAKFHCFRAVELIMAF